MTPPRRSALALCLAMSATLAAAQESPKAQLRALRKELDTAVEQWRAGEQKKVQDAVAAGQPVPMMSMVPPTKEFIARAQELAGKYSGTEAALGFHAFVIERASIERAAMQAALAALLRDHCKDEAIGYHLDMLKDRAAMLGRDNVLALFGKVVAENEHEEAQVEALIARSAVRLAGAKDDAERQLARQDLQKIKAVTTDEDYLARADAILFEIDNLQVGCKVPEIEGQDTDGVAFKLSDYRGKVVLLDFWGFW